MSEMSAEKKKEIEKYIIKSYFGSGKNVESLANGADVIKGTDDGYIPQLIVEVTYFGESGVVMIKWNIYGDSQQNSFAMRVCRERETEQNRCDSVDSMRYAWEAWRAKIQGKPVFSKTSEKDKRIEELEKEVKALRAEKEKFYTMFDGCEPAYVKQRIDEMKDEIKNLNKKLEAFDPLPDFRELLKKLHSTDDVENLAWVLNHTCGGRGSVNGWIAVSLFWKQNYETLSKLVGFSSVEEIQDYLTNEAKCDTLHEAIHLMCREMDLRQKKIDELLDDISGRSTVIEHYKRDVTRLQEKADSKAELARQREINYIFLLNRTGFDTVADLVNYLDSEAECDTLHEAISKLHDDAKKEIESLKAVIRRSDSVMLNELENNIDEWQKATGCDSPMKAESKIDELETLIEEWKKATERCTPFLAGLRLGTLRDSYIRHNRLLFGEVRPEHMVCVGEKKKTIRQYLRDCDYNSAVDAINKLESEISEWRDATGGCLNPYYAKIKFEAYNNYIGTKLEKKD